MPTTGAPGNIWYPDGASPVSPLQNLFLQLATSVNAALGNINPTRTSFTPAFSGWSAGNSVIEAYKTIVNGICHIELKIVLGSTGAPWTSSFILNLEDDAAMQWNSGPYNGVILATDVSASKRYAYPSLMASYNRRNAFLFSYTGDTGTSGVIPFAPATGDIIQANFSYVLA